MIELNKSMLSQSLNGRVNKVVRKLLARVSKEK